MERPKGFEPLYSGWKPEVLPLNDGRDVSQTWLAASDSNRASRTYQARAFPTKLAANMVELVGVEPTTFRMSTGRSTTELQLKIEQSLTKEIGWRPRIRTGHLALIRRVLFLLS